MMTERARCIWMIGLMVLFCSACADFESKFKLPKMLATSDLRLLSMQVPRTVGDDLPYDIVVSFESEGQPQIRKACFRWLSEKAAVSSPSLYCYASDSAANNPIDSACTRWLSEGPYAQSSPLFCAKAEKIEYGQPGRFTVRIQSGNVEQIYNKLECYVEYMRGEETDISNRVSARIRVEKLQE